MIRLKIDQRFETEIPNIRSFTHGKVTHLKTIEVFGRTLHFMLVEYLFKISIKKTQDQVQGTLNNDLKNQIDFRAFTNQKAIMLKMKIQQSECFFLWHHKLFFISNPFFNSGSVLLNFYMN